MRILRTSPRTKRDEKRIAQARTQLEIPPDHLSQQQLARSLVSRRNRKLVGRRVAGRFCAAAAAGAGIFLMFTSSCRRPENGNVECSQEGLFRRYICSEQGCVYAYSDPCYTRTRCCCGKLQGRKVRGGSSHCSAISIHLPGRVCASVK